MNIRTAMKRFKSFYGGRKPKRVPANKKGRRVEFLGESRGRQNPRYQKKKKKKDDSWERFRRPTKGWFD